MTNIYNTVHSIRKAINVKTVVAFLFAFAIVFALGVSLPNMSSASAAEENYTASSMAKFEKDLISYWHFSGSHDAFDDALDYSFRITIENNIVKFDNYNRYNYTLKEDTEIEFNVDGGAIFFMWGEEVSIPLTDSVFGVNYVSGETYPLMVFVSGINVNCNEHSICSWYSKDYFTIDFTYYKITQVTTPPDITGYTFDGWYYDQAYTNKFTGTVIVGDVTLYAKYNTINYSITYNLNGGGLTGHKTSYTVEEAFTLATPTKTGYTFGGWYTNSGLTGTAVTSIPKGTTGNKTYWAKWTIDNYSISYTLNGGTHSNAPTSYTVETNTINLTTPTRTGYTFGGWYTNSGLTGTAVTQIAKGSTGNKAYFAKWTADNYTITYNLDGGSHSNPTANYTIETATITLSTPTKTGYTFDGWFDNAGKTGTAVTKINSGSTGNKTFWAKWTADIYTITYNLNGGTHSAPSNYTIETATITLTTPTRTGYTFGGWYTASNFSGSPVTSIPKGTTGNKQFYAKWTTITYTLEYELNGAEEIELTESYTVETATITLPTLSKTGHNFVGWFSNAEFSGNAVTQIAKGTTGNKSLYAKFTPIVYKVTLIVNGVELAVLDVEYGTYLSDISSIQDLSQMGEGLYEDVEHALAVSITL